MNIRLHCKIFITFINFRTHTKETPYQCPICSSAYSYRSTLKSHMAKVHNQVPTPNASLLRQQSDEQVSPNKLQLSNISEGNICDRNIQENLSLKDAPGDNFSDVVMTRLHPNYSLQQSSSEQDELIDGSDDRMSSNYESVQIDSRITHEEQSIGPSNLLINF